MNTVYDLSAFLTTAAILYYCNNHYGFQSLLPMMENKRILNCKKCTDL